MGIKVIIADDHKLIRQGLCSLLDREKDIKVVAQTGKGREAVNLVDNLKPDVVILDINMPDLNGIDAAKHILNQHNDVKIIALSMNSSRRFVSVKTVSAHRRQIMKKLDVKNVVELTRIAVSEGLISADY